MTATATGDLVGLLEGDGVELRKETVKEYAGACPWCGGRDRFRVWPRENRYWCRQCDRKGDAIQYLRDRHNLSYQDACRQLGTEPGDRQIVTPAPVAPRRLNLPSELWRERGWNFVYQSIDRLHEEDGTRALAWLQNRGLSPETIKDGGFGYNSTDLHEDRESWGLPAEIDGNGRPKQVWLPRGIVIPWRIENDLWRINIRRPVGNPKYIGPGGWSNALYNADQIRSKKPVVLLEGEIDAQTMIQHAGDLAAAVATGSTGGSREVKWISHLARASVVLVAFDSDDAGEKASFYWVDVLPNAKRWRPFWGDTNAMAQDGADLRSWLRQGLTE